MYRRTLPAACGLVFAAALVTGCGSSASTGSATSPAPATSSAAPSASAPAGAAPSTSSAPASVSAASRAGDVAFAQAMIPHHEQAVEMADLALRNGAGADVTALATQIRAAQAPEIATMRGWLAAWGAGEDMGMDHAAMGHMPGMMSDEDLKTLAAARGAAFDERWLTMMVAHHEGALTMAQGVLATTQDPQVRTLAEAVVTGQTQEIGRMKALLAG